VLPELYIHLQTPLLKMVVE